MVNGPHPSPKGDNTCILIMNFEHPEIWFEVPYYHGEQCNPLASCLYSGLYISNKNWARFSASYL